ncbi:type II toxin-antitoxin system VapC family toxin [Fibrobacter succinogenes]|uniref:type II toxin-antitoxin system VapC family toxin n=1 Tax=Fibrobacter succinogenes TaxID=833 RepID=UPI001568E420|nr:type II toxin-antitoxin system VapC family toxin [Fibrobacter succinogenes]
MKIYLDNCCYNRPYDDQSHLTISIEAQAKMQIQALVKAQKLQLASSFILDYENSCNPYTDRKSAITKFLNDNVFDYVGSDKSDVIATNAKKIMATGVKMKDACHIACAELMNCDYLLSTDKRMLKYKSNSIKLINPIEFLNLISGGAENDN